MMIWIFEDGDSDNDYDYINVLNVCIRSLYVKVYLGFVYYFEY